MFHYEPGKAINNDKESTDRAVRVIERLYGKDAVQWGRPMMGGEDFSLYQEKIPGVFISLGGVTDGVYRPQHTDKTLVDEKILAYGLEFYLNYVFEYLNEN